LWVPRFSRTPNRASGRGSQGKDGLARFVCSVNTLEERTRGDKSGREETGEKGVMISNGREVATSLTVRRYLVFCRKIVAVSAN